MKTALITGASRGIGLATAHKFKSSGYRVIATARKEADLEKLRSLGFEAHRLEVTDLDNISTLHEELKASGKLPDILVNNAGVADLASLARISEKDFDHTLDVNLKSALFMTQKFVKNMAKNKFGRIVNVSSILSSLPQKGFASYAASKAGLEAFSRVAALEYAEKGVTINCVAAGFVDTDMIKSLANAEQLKAQIPTRSIASPEQIASAILFLAEQSNITGEVIQTNGGLLMKP